jgi:hypothetical protein
MRYVMQCLEAGAGGRVTKPAHKPEEAAREAVQDLGSWEEGRIIVLRVAEF